MPKLRVLVTIATEAIVEVADDVTDVDGFLRDQVSLAWGGVLVERPVHEDVSVAFYPVEEPAEEPVTALEEMSAADVAATTDEVDRAVALAEASIVEVAPEAAAEESEPAAVEAVGFLDATLVEEAAPTESAAEVEAAAPVAPRDLTDDEVLSLFTDPLYKDMIRAAVRDRAVAMLEVVVAEVVSDLVPLIKRQAERRRPAGS
jgi:hypothetical protein